MSPFYTNWCYQRPAWCTTKVPGMHAWECKWAHLCADTNELVRDTTNVKHYIMAFNFWWFRLSNALHIVPSVHLQISPRHLSWSRFFKTRNETGLSMYGTYSSHSVQCHWQTATRFSRWLFLISNSSKLTYFCSHRYRTLCTLASRYSPPGIKLIPGP